MMTPADLAVEAHEQALDDAFAADLWHADLRLRTLDALLDTLSIAWQRHRTALDVAYQLGDQDLIRKLSNDRAWIMRMHASVTGLRRGHLDQLPHDTDTGAGF